MANYLSPFSSRQFIDANGNPYSGALLFTYVAGSTTKVTTYKNEAGSSSHANPIVLNTRGEPADGSAVTYPIWQIGGAAVKFVLAPSTDTDPPGSPIATWDNIDGINDTSVTVDQWITGPTPTYVGATSFTLVGDQTSTFHIGRRIKTTNSGGTIYSTITNSVYGASTTVTVVNDSGTLDAGLSAVSYGVITATGTSIPGGTHPAITTFSGNNTHSGNNSFSGANTHSGLESFALTKFSNPLGPRYLNNISIDATAAANALTVTLYGNDGASPSATNPVQLSFRNSTLTTGTSTVATATAATTITAPDGATLGFIASEDSYVYVYALNNAGTVELALSGSPSWDTNILQSTTAIGTGSDTRTVLYSTALRSNVAIRFIGLIKIATGATPGQWGSAATIKATATDTPPVLSVGYCQTWQTVTGSRAVSTNYYNSTGRPIQVVVDGKVSNSVTGTIIVDGVSVSQADNQATAVLCHAYLSAIVPPGSYYSFTSSGGFWTWVELR